MKITRYRVYYIPQLRRWGACVDRGAYAKKKPFCTGPLYKVFEILARRERDRAEWMSRHPFTESRQ